MEARLFFFWIALVAPCFAFGQHQKFFETKPCLLGTSYWCSHIKHAKECGTMDTCMTKVWPKQTSDVKTEPNCTFCELTVKEARRMLHNKATKQELEAFLSKICIVIPSGSLIGHNGVKEECEKLIDKYLPEIVTLITSEVNAKVVCTAFGFCKRNKSEKLLFTPQHALLSDAHVQFDSSRMASKLGHHNIKLNANNDTFCTDCHKFVADVRDIVTNHATEAHIESFLIGYCANFRPLQSVCRRFVALEIPVFFKFLYGEINPDVICVMIGFCGSNKKKNTKMHMNVQSSAEKMTDYGEKTCSTCEMVTGKVQQMHKRKEFQDAMKSFIEQNLCTRLGPYAAECNFLVEKYAPQIFEFLAVEFDPDVFCVRFGFCKKHTVKSVKLPAGVRSMVPLKSVRSQVTNPVTCEVCQYAMSYLDSLLEDNRTEEAIKEALDALCGYLPSSYQSECNGFVNQYTDEIIRLLVSELANPAEVCTELGLCSSHEKQPLPLLYIPLISVLTGGGRTVKSSTDILSLASSKPVKKLLPSDDKCEICKFVVKELDALLDLDKTEEAITKALDKVCDLAPDKFKAECLSFVNEYAPIIIQLITAELNPVKVCEDILHFCNETITLPLERAHVPSTGLIRDISLLRKKRGTE